MENENTTNAICVDCGHTDHTKYDDGLRGICMNSECDCTVFTTATSGEVEIDTDGVQHLVGRTITAAHRFLPSGKDWQLCEESLVLTLDDGSVWEFSGDGYSASSLSIVAIFPSVRCDSLQRKVDEILCGIDQMETDSNYGWWETSTGAEFGAKKKAEIIALINTSGERCDKCGCPAKDGRESYTHTMAELKRKAA